MCEANVYIIKDSERKLIMENVITLHPEGKKVLLTDLFGEQKLVTATVETVDLTGHEIILRG